MAKTEQTTKTEQQVPSLAKKILLIKSKIGKISKEGEATVDRNGKKIRYATLNAILDKLTPILEEQGVNYQITLLLNDTTIPMLAANYRVFSLVFFDVETGEATEPLLYPFRLATNTEPIKADGSTITYATRYMLGMALGIQTEDDPDSKFQSQQPQQPTKEEWRNLYVLIESTDFDKAAKNVKELQSKYKGFDFSNVIFNCSTMKKKYQDFRELMDNGLMEKAQEAITDAQTLYPKSNFSVWQKQLDDCNANIN
jgi:hypothetical protein